MQTPDEREDIVKAVMIGESRQKEASKPRMTVETILRELQAMRTRTSELRRQLEEMKKRSLERRNNVPRCTECDNELDPKQEIVIRDPQGTEERYYHKKCFQALFR